MSGLSHGGERAVRLNRLLRKSRRLKGRKPRLEGGGRWHQTGGGMGAPA
jgi:hypothetical protein